MNYKALSLTGLTIVLVPLLVWANNVIWIKIFKSPVHLILNDMLSTVLLHIGFTFISILLLALACKIIYGIYSIYKEIL